MIRSMTAYGTARSETEQGTLAMEIRSVNNRFLDLNLRIPEEMRFAEPALREQITRQVRRGKLEFRLNYRPHAVAEALPLDEAAIRSFAAQLQWARQFIPDLPAPALADLPHRDTGHGDLDPALWGPIIQRTCQQALEEFDATRAREGQRLAQAMLQLADDIAVIVAEVERDLPALVQQYQDHVAQRLRDALSAANPGGFNAISGAELSARIVQEASLFGLRVDVAEELTRLNAHLQELQAILTGAHPSAGRGQGKRLDFLFQEMNREANTLGSKAAALSVTQAAIDLKLLIEQLREQAQNIE